MVETRTSFPPHEMTPDEEAAVVGRYVENPEAIPDPAGSGRAGREQAAPHGVVYVRAETLETETEPEPEEEEEEPEAEPEPEPEPEPEAVEEPAVQEIDVESLTVAELQQELEDFGVEYDKHARKDELKQALYDALG